MTPQRVTMITLSVLNIAVSREFYLKLGWQEAKGGNDKIAFFKLRGLYLSLYSRDALTSDIGMPIATRTTGAITLATNYESPDAVDAAYDTALKAGAIDVTKPAKTDWGGYSGMIADPDGHLWEYAHNPFWSFDDDGYLTGNA
ncbi:VOC family protein [Neptunicoccus cionae]|uniref:Glyoxalase n=1 Tax=Neptunicoccus cionae TaxID=2035344 RepID=A0A916R1B2_9RHOB|nr:VOC family protein [Amylibacter cionae]GGA30040.1 glyoxalase [Amylibacter cionae]